MTGLDPDFDPLFEGPPRRQSFGSFVIAMAVIVMALAVALIGAYGCAPVPDAAPPATTFALVTYSPAFSAALAVELRTAPQEVKTAITDYVKLRCAINPNMQICRDLQK